MRRHDPNRPQPVDHAAFREDVTDDQETCSLVCVWRWSCILCLAGNPKGVVLTHTNVLSTVVGMQTYCTESKLDYGASDNVLSYLTMAHILGRVVEEFALSCGASIGYWQVGPGLKHAAAKLHVAIHTRALKS